MKIIKYFIALSIIVGMFISVLRCNPEEEKLSGRSITAFTVASGSTEYTGVINSTNITFSNKVPFGITQVSIKAFTLSEKANASKKVGDNLVVGSTNSITVTAENSSTQTYSVTITAQQQTDIFQTLSGGAQTAVSINNSQSGANISVSITSKIGNIDTGTIVQYGHIYSDTAQGDELVLGASNVLSTSLNSSSNKTSKNPTGEYTSTLSDLNTSTTYFVRPYITTANGTAYGNQINFTTLNNEANILSLSIEVSISGGSPFTQTRSVADGTISGTTIIFTGLPFGTTQARVSAISLSNQAKATIGANTFGENSLLSVGTNNVTVEASDKSAQIYTISLINEPAMRPQVATIAATNVSYTTATLNAKVITIGEASITNHGFIYSTNYEATLTLEESGTNVQVGTNTGFGDFTTNLTGLSDNTIYYYVSYASNSGGTSYGLKAGFTTLDATPPSVNLINASVSGMTFTLEGNLSDIGTGSTQVSQHGFVYASTISGEDLVVSGNGVTTISLGTKNSIGNFTGAFTASSASTYYIKVYAANAFGITYGNTISLSTSLSGSYINIPDDIFRNAIISCINNGHTRVAGDYKYACTENYEGNISADGSLISKDVLESITKFNYNNGIPNHNDTSIRINDATGVSYMKSLNWLALDYNNLNSLQIENNTTLVILRASNNSLTNLEVSNLTLLTNLNLYNNKLENLDVGNLTVLANLDIINNSLTSLDISNNTRLTNLGSSFNPLGNLNVSNNTQLFSLVATSNSLSSIDVSSLTRLSKLYLNSNSLTSINISSNTKLRTLFVSTNPLNSIDLSTNTELDYLSMQNNSFTYLDLSTNTALENLIVATNSLTSLDVGIHTALNRLWVFSNSLTSLDVSNNTSLTYLWVDRNSSLTCIQTASGQSIENVTKDLNQTLSGNCGY